MTPQAAAGPSQVGPEAFETAMHATALEPGAADAADVSALLSTFHRRFKAR